MDMMLESRSVFQRKTSRGHEHDGQGVLCCIMTTRIQIDDKRLASVRPSIGYCLPRSAITAGGRLKKRWASHEDDSLAEQQTAEAAS
ncbi:hypothetical protein DOTSEDRAFT_72755 [Dothistroma septosporum NZE10]|uniref:Uncharacterized protein n=1 Tax=Dothistroma septosporum (strain NZE10 / CBS 128990) TaxID=675120 RepID=M2YPE2_DOTSN|nr:hypothetical protein DOTSEDRAFT_72755 [Dothistroma septosporum NZE10]